MYLNDYILLFNKREKASNAGFNYPTTREINPNTNQNHIKYII